MVHTRSNRLSLLLMVGLVFVGGSMLATPAVAQDRFRVLVPKRLERQGDIDEDFGEDVNKELKKLIDGLPTHTPLDEDELEDAADQYGLDDDELTCIQSRQLAAQKGYELVFCGEYSQGGGGMQVAASFISPRENETFEIDAFAATDPKQAAQHIFESFESYVRLLSSTKFCMDDIQSQNWQAALERCDAALAISEASKAAHYGRGYALMKLEQFEPSLEALRKVLEIDPINQDALMAAGFVAAKLGRNDESRNYYNEYLSLNPGDAQVRLSIATEAANAGDPMGALQIAEAGMQGDSINLVLAEYAGYFAVSAASQVEQATQGSEGENGTSGPPAEAQSLYEKALGYFQQVWEAKADSVSPTFLTNHLNTLNKLGRTQEAADFGAQAVQKAPGEATLWSTYANVLRDAGRLDEALAALDSVLAKDPAASRVRARQGQWLLQAGNFDGAMAAFRQAVADGELTGDQAARQFLAIGINDKYQKKLYEEGLPYYQAALELTDDAVTQGMAHFFIGYTLYVRAEKMQAPSTAESARAALPVFQQAMEHFQQAAPYAETVPSVASSLQQLRDGTTQYIEIQNALIKRGR